jgi:uncharacterized membrane protein YkoI
MRNKYIEKRILKRIITISLMLVMVLILASCGSSNEVTPEPTEPAIIETHELPAQPATEPATDDIGYDKVKSIVLDRVPGATEADVYELERDYDDGMLQYEGSVYYGGYEYEFEINGVTGDILQWEIDD